LAIGQNITFTYSRFGGFLLLGPCNRLPQKYVPKESHWRAFAGHYMGPDYGVFLRTGPEIQPDFRHVLFAMYLPVFLESGAELPFTILSHRNRVMFF